MASLEEADRFSGHFGVFLVRAGRIRRDLGDHIVGLHQVVGNHVVLDFLARDVGQHHPVDLDAGGQGLTGLAHHLRVIVAVVDDIDVLVGETVLAHDGTDTVGPPTAGLEIGNDIHASSKAPDRSGAT